MEFLGSAEVNYYRTIATAVQAINEGENPKEVVTAARRAWPRTAGRRYRMVEIYAAADAA